MSKDKVSTLEDWQELDNQGVAGLVGKILQNNAQESAWIHKQINEYDKDRIKELEQQLAYWRPLGQRFLQIQDALTFREPAS